MKAKTIIDESKAYENLHLRGILDYVPHSTEPRPGSEPYDIMAMIEGYESEGREILKAGGYPLTVREIIYRRYAQPKKELLPRRIKDVMNMLAYFERVRDYMKKNDISYSLCFMAYGVQAAMKARIRPVEPLIEMGQKNVSGGIDGGKKSGKNRRLKAEPTKANWQTEAEKIWKKHPAWSNSAVAVEIAKRIGGNIGTIRRSIKKTTP